MAARACKRCEAGACKSTVHSEGARGRRWHLRSKQQATRYRTVRLRPAPHGRTSREPSQGLPAPRSESSEDRQPRVSPSQMRLETPSAAGAHLPRGKAAHFLAGTPAKPGQRRRPRCGTSCGALASLARDAEAPLRRLSRMSKPSIDPHVALLEVAAARTGAKCQQDFSAKHEQVRRRRQRPQSHRCRFEAHSH